MTCPSPGGNSQAPPRAASMPAPMIRRRRQ
jgi:hypothetical protein